MRTTRTNVDYGMPMISTFAIVSSSSFRLSPDATQREAVRR
jgi:hypothetical protein